MPKKVVVGSRKGGVGKSTMAYEVAYVLGAVLVDFEWDGDSVSRRWGYRHEERATDPLMAALDKGRTPRVLKGFRKPDLVPGSPLLLDATLTPDEFADAIAKWAEEWGRDLVVDTHPGASASAHGAMSVADVICVPTGLKTGDLNGTEQMVKEMLDYPLVIVPNMVRRVPPAAEIKRLTSIVEGTPVRVGPPIPFVGAVEVRKRRIAMTAENPVPRAILKVVDAYRDLGAFVQEYVS
ncbi:MAG: chromosome partitioning protein ParA [Frankiales bacterium]|nr:chromosome partitioning protein ParA [Frankiales bacterium]